MDPACDDICTTDCSMRAVKGLRLAFRKFARPLDRRMKRRGLATATEQDTLEYLAIAEKNAVDLQRKLGIPQYSVSRLVKDLLGRNLLARRRHAGDRRGHLLRTTAQGLDMLERSFDAYQSEAVDLGIELTGTNIKDLQRWLDRFP